MRTPSSPYSPRRSRSTARSSSPSCGPPSATLTKESSFEHHAGHTQLDLDDSSLPYKGAAKDDERMNSMPDAMELLHSNLHEVFSSGA
jgi:hypothetical protein